MFKPNSKATFILFLVFIGLGLTLTYLSTHGLKNFGWQLYDEIQLKTAPSIAPNVALISFNQETLDQLASQDHVYYPFPREIFVALLSVANAVGARALVFDILFTEPSSYGPEDDDRFADAIKKSKVPSFFPSKSEGGTVHEPISKIRSASTGLGSVVVSSDDDGVIRHFTKDGLDSVVAEYIGVTSRPNHNDLVRYYQQSAFKTLSFYKILSGYRAIKAGQPLPPEFEALKDQIWIIGYSAPGLHDLKPIPTDPQAPGYLVIASRLANRLSYNYLSKGDIYLSLGSAMIAILITVAFGTFLGSITGSIALSLASAISIPTALTTLFWYKYSIWLDPIPVLAGSLFSYISVIIYNYYHAWRDRLKLAGSVAATMSPTMVRLIRSGKVSVSRFGEERVITVMFCDLAGFTSLSESLPPRTLVEILNDYMDMTVDQIIGNDGYVDKFIGDAVMAFWGAPLEQKNHSELCIRSAIEYSNFSNKLNEFIKEKYGINSNFYGRIGIHTGPAIVGNMGSRRRHNYTAIGDTVNLASRLESLGKHYHVSVLVSESSINEAGMANLPDLLEIDRVRVKGRATPTRLFTFIQGLNPESKKSYSRGLELYYSGQWETAAFEFKKASNIPCSEIMLARCNMGLAGTLTNWSEGIWSYDEK